MNNQIAEYLNRLKNIYLAIDGRGLQKDIKKLDELSKVLKEAKEGKPITPRQKKNSFNGTLQLLLEKNYEGLNGTKLDYKTLTTQDEVESFIEAQPKTKILKSATALDLKLLYSLLTKDPNEIKGTKSDVLEAIKRNIRARKRGEAFKKTF